MFSPLSLVQFANVVARDQCQPPGYVTVCHGRGKPCCLVESECLFPCMVPLAGQTRSSLMVVCTYYVGIYHLLPGSMSAVSASHGNVHTFGKHNEI